MSEEVGVEVPIPHYTMLLPHTDDPTEPMRYDCSLCDLDVYNISLHSQFEHGVRKFTVDNEEHERERPVVGHLCGISGCTFDGNHEGRHSWEPAEQLTPQDGKQGDIGPIDVSN